MDDGREQSAAAQHQPPVSTTLTTSSPTCSLIGEPPFTATTTYERTTSRPIWALVRLFTDFGGGIEIRDPVRKHRQVGARSTIIADEWDEHALDLDDTALVWLESGQTFSTLYTVSVVPKVNGLRDSDVKHLVVGNTYEITLRKRRWRWMFEDEMGGGLSEKERRVLRKRKVVEWKVDRMVIFEAV
jgi:hypothetical protein